MTPTDIVAARRLGADAFKIFPAAQAGGPGYLRALQGPFPDAPFVPVGGWTPTRPGPISRTGLPRWVSGRR